MGAFGLIYALIVGGAYLVESIEKSKSSEESRNYAIKNNYPTYLHETSRGREERLVSNGHPSGSYMLENGDHVLIDKKTGQVVRNYSADRRSYYQQKNIQKAKEAGNSVYLYDEDRHRDMDFVYDGKNNSHLLHQLYGCRYKDFNTGRLYVVRSVYGPNGYVYFYMDAVTRRYVRKTDGQLEKERKYKERYNINYDADCRLKGKPNPTVEDANAQLQLDLQKARQGLMMEYEAYNQGAPSNGKDCS